MNLFIFASEMQPIFSFFILKSLYLAWILFTKHTMKAKEIKTIYAQIIRLLDNRELNAAFESLLTLSVESNMYLFSDEVYNLEATYKQLLYYFSTGTKDPMRVNIYNNILASTYELTDRIKQKALSGGFDPSSEMYYSVQRTYEANPENISVLLNEIISSYDVYNNTHAEKLSERLFKSIWTDFSISDNDIKSLHQSLLADNTESSFESGYMTIINCQIVSALTLAIEKFFDKKKILLLIDAAESNDKEVKIRAYIALLIILYFYKNRIESYPEILHRLDNLAENADFKTIVRLIILRFIISRETEKISNKVKDEIIPEMMKLNPKLNPNLSIKDLHKENIDFDMNPEWMEKLSDSSLGKKIDELNKLQEEGADVMHSTFIHLKNYPFFNEINSWFMPFNKYQSFLSGEDTVMKSMEIITDVRLMCNSDLYSLFFSIKMIPEEGRKMMISQLESQLTELKQQKTAELQTRNDNIELITGQYVQDLYRFHKLFQRKHEFEDIFTQKLDFHNLPILQRYFSDKNDLQNIAEYYLHKNYFDDALVIYEQLSESDEMFFQKKGYCLQMTENHEGALKEYAKAELINPKSKWLLRRIAQCYRALKKPEKAIDYYIHYEKIDPANLSVLLSIGSCYLEMKNYSEALKYYFKVDYIDQDSDKAQRPIAWCSFLINKYDQARNYYNKILSHQPGYQDYINAGHTEWALQNIKGALDLYSKSIKAANLDYQKFKTEFENDIPELTAAGIDKNEIPIMLDKLKTSSTENFIN